MDERVESKEAGHANTRREPGSAAKDWSIHEMQYDVEAASSGDDPPW